MKAVKVGEMQMSSNDIGTVEGVDQVARGSGCRIYRQMRALRND